MYQVFVRGVQAMMMVLILGSFVPAALAGDWRSNYMAPDGTECCGEHDCRRLGRSIFLRLGEKIVLEPGQPPVEVRIIHPSEDGVTYLCRHTGCGFQPGVS